MATDTSRSFSHAISEHRNKASGFSEEDIIHETFHNSLDANADIINYEFINNEKDGYYLMIFDNGDGCEKPPQLLGIGDSILKKESKIGCKNIGFVGSSAILEPIEYLILSKVETNKNIRSLRYNSGEHYKQLDNMKTVKNDYRKIDQNLDNLIIKEISEDIYQLINDNIKYISESSLKLVEHLKKNKGTVIILQLSRDSYENLINATINNQVFMTKLILMSKKIDNINFYENKVTKKNGKYIDILNNSYKPLVFDVTYFQKDNKRYFEEKIYANERSDDTLITTNYLLSSSKGICGSDVKIDFKKDNIIGNFVCKYQFMNQREWEEIGKPYEAANKRSLIYDFYDGSYRILSESKNTSDSIFRNGGPFFFSIYINDLNMEFAEKYLGIKTNKRESTMDSLHTEMKYYLITRVRNKLVKNISDYTNNTTLGKFNNYRIAHANKNLKDFKPTTIKLDSPPCAEGIKDWSPYKKYIKDIISHDSIQDYKLLDNIFIEEYIDRNKLVIDTNSIPIKSPGLSSSTLFVSGAAPIQQNKVLSKKSSPKQLSPKQKLKPVDLKVEHNVYWGEITIDINSDDFDKVEIKYMHNNKMIILNEIDTQVYIDNLTPHAKYTFTITGYKKECEHKIKEITLTPNKKVEPEKPEFTVDDSTHDIKFTFINPNDNGLPIKDVLFFENGNTKCIKRCPFAKEIIIPDFIHKETRIEVQYINEVGPSLKSDIKKIKSIECKRAVFTEAVKDQILNNNGHKCAITGIQIDDHYFRCEFDHIGRNCNNSVSNCQPLLTEIHNIKSYNRELYEKLSRDPKELFNYKLYRMKAIFDSMTTEEKEEVKSISNINRINQLLR
jgi:hypothetical protein